jgi:general secretion pathway protein G
MPRKNAGGRGFTILELMFSVVVIGVLMTIAIPAYNGYKDSTNNAIAIADIHLMELSIAQYYNQTSAYPATLADIAANLPNNGIDPWGNAYVYLNILNGGPGIKGKVRKDHSLN